MVRPANAPPGAHGPSERLCWAGPDGSRAEVGACASYVLVMDGLLRAMASPLLDTNERRPRSRRARAARCREILSDVVADPRPRSASEARISPLCISGANALSPILGDRGRRHGGPSPRPRKRPASRHPSREVDAGAVAISHRAQPSPVADRRGGPVLRSGALSVRDPLRGCESNLVYARAPSGARPAGRRSPAWRECLLEVAGRCRHEPSPPTALAC
jgi:hypothetical protein